MKMGAFFIAKAGKLPKTTPDLKDGDGTGYG